MNNSTPKLSEQIYLSNVNATNRELRNLSLEQIAGEVRQLAHTVDAGAWRLAACVCLSREFFCDSKAWEAWGKDAAGIHRAEMYRYKRCWEWLCAMSAHQNEYTEINRMGIDRIDALHRIEPARFPDFVRASPTWSSLDREELRAAVNVFLGVAQPKGNAQDFIQLELPSLKDILASCDIPQAVERMNPRREFDYSMAFLKRAVAALKIENGQDIDVVRNMYRTLKEEVTDIEAFFVSNNIEM